MRHPKRGGGGADPGYAAVLDFVGLGEFARLSLPDHPPGELGLSAAYDDDSGRIVVSICGGSVSASPADLAGALGLPMGPVGLLAGWDAAVFSTAEAIRAVKGFVFDRVLLGWGGSDYAVSMEVSAAMRLVEDGKAYEVNWGGLIWALVKSEVVAGTPWRYAPYLLHLMVRQRPELFSESLPLGKRLKGQVLQQCHLEDEEEASLAFLEEMPIFGSQNMSIFSQPHELGGNSSNQTPPCFQTLLQQMQGCMRDIGSKYLDKEKTCSAIRHEVECIKNMVMEKEQQIEAIVDAIRKDLSARSVVMRSLEADKDQMSRSIQHYAKLLKKSSAQFQEYRNSEHVKKLTEMGRSIASLNHEVERLKNCRSIPDLNNGVEEDGEGKASLAMTVSASWTGEGDHVSNTTKGGKWLVELIANPDQRNDTRESMDLDGAPSGIKLCR